LVAVLSTNHSQIAQLAAVSADQSASIVTVRQLRPVVVLPAGTLSKAFTSTDSPWP
jgi:hypothetical protein